jgi:hypothetical protein
MGSEGSENRPEVGWLYVRRVEPGWTCLSDARWPKAVSERVLLSAKTDADELRASDRNAISTRSATWLGG